MLWKWLGDEGFEDLPLDDLWDRIKSMCCRPGRAGVNIFPEEEEEGESVPGESVDSL
jgi:hypothetical protein